MDRIQQEKYLESYWAVRFCLTLLLLGQVWWRFLQGKTCYRRIIENTVKVGPSCLPPVLLVAGFAGMIFTVQTARELVRFGAGSVLGGAFALGYCRELAPILAACLVAGQVSSAFAAEIGAMRITEQIDVLYMLKTDPIDYLVTPRVLACTLMMPIVIILSLVVGIAGGTFTAAFFYHFPADRFLESIRIFLEPMDLLSIWIKGLVFGAIIAVIGCSWGLTTKGGVRQVGESATAAVIVSWVSIFAINFFLSLLLFGNPII